MNQARWIQYRGFALKMSGQPLGSILKVLPETLLAEAQGLV
jgi:hypothetical protein